MAMLAERRRKQKWTVIPRGKQWSEDENKFGQKMLEKMGWSKGKGLGSKLHGITEHVRVAYKNDQNGIGYKLRDDQWTEHQEGFNALLENLAAGSSKDGKEPELKFKSLEEKSKVSKARVHYGKFTRGKDLSRASAKDLANIFGKKSLLADAKKEQPDEVKSENAEGFVKNGGSMFDYFKKKLPGFGKNAEGYMTGSNGVLKKGSDSEDEARGGFGFAGFGGGSRAGFGFKEEERAVETVGVTNSAFDPFVTKVEVKKHVLNPIQENDEESYVENHVENHVVNNVELRGNNQGNAEDAGGIEKKMKKCKIRNKRNSQNGSLEMIEEVDGKKRKGDDLIENKKKKFKKDVSVSREEIEESVTEVKVQKTKKKKKQFENSLCEDYSLGSNGYQEEAENCEVAREAETGEAMRNAENPYEVVRKEKKKKKNKVKVGVAVEVEPETPKIKQSCPTKKKTKKWKNEPIEEIQPNENPCFAEVEEIGNCNDEAERVQNPYEVVRKQKKRKLDASIEDLTPKAKKSKKNKLESSAIENPSFDTTANDSRNNNEFEVTRKKKKKLAEISAVDNPTFADESVTRDDSSLDDAAFENSSVNNNAFEVSRKKKKKKAALNDSAVAASFEEPDDNNTFEVKRKVKKSKASAELSQEETSITSTDGSKVNNNAFEVTRKKPKKVPQDNPNFDEDLEDPKDNNAFEVPRKMKKTKNSDEESIGESDLVLNVTATPVAPILKSASSTSKKRRSVRFSSVNEERIIPNLDDLAKNELFELNKQLIQVGIADRMEAYRKKIEEAQAQLENEINQAKIEAEKFVGETETEEGEAERLPDGSCLLKFKDAKFHDRHRMGLGKQDSTSRAKAAYRKRIKGDIVVQFNGCNLHEIKGYATEPVRTIDE